MRSHWIPLNYFILNLFFSSIFLICLNFIPKDSVFFYSIYPATIILHVTQSLPLASPHILHIWGNAALLPQPRPPFKFTYSTTNCRRTRQRTLEPLAGGGWKQNMYNLFNITNSLLFRWFHSLSDIAHCTVYPV